jgi:ribosomal protein S18 acetylase RimI-like enzyme
MEVVQRREPTDACRAFLLDQLPRSEFLVSLLDEAQLILEVRERGCVVGAAVGVESGHTLSGSKALVALLADDDGVRRMLAQPLLTLTAGLGRLELFGPGDVAESVARDIARLIGGWASRVMEQRLLICSEALIPWHVAGWMRPMQPTDHPLVAGWMDAFAVEALGVHDTSREVWNAQLQSVGSSMRLWERDGVPVAMAMGRLSTPISHRVGPVYTPPSMRRRGYAAALTAHVTESALERGAERVVLLTDATNSTSNRVYVGVGYIDIDRHANWVVTTAA